MKKIEDRREEEARWETELWFRVRRQRILKVLFGSCLDMWENTKLLFLLS